MRHDVLDKNFAAIKVSIEHDPQAVSAHIDYPSLFPVLHAVKALKANFQCIWRGKVFVPEDQISRIQCGSMIWINYCRFPERPSSDDMHFSLKLSMLETF